jgi:hypothetical protein
MALALGRTNRRGLGVLADQWLHKFGHLFIEMDNSDFLVFIVKGNFRSKFGCDG